MNSRRLLAPALASAILIAVGVVRFRAEGRASTASGDLPDSRKEMRLRSKETPRLSTSVLPERAEPPSRPMRPGFELHPGTSRFPVGPNPRQVRENGYEKTVGDHGVFASNPRNGASFGVPNSDAPSTKRPPMTKDGALHNARVMDYFVNAGLPRDQVKSVRVSTLMEVRGTATDPVQGIPEFKAFNSGVQRSIDGIPIPDSLAWARFNADDQAVEEAAFWPSVPESVVDAARSLQGILEDPELRGDYLAKLPSEAAEKGRVVIRHSSFTVNETPTFYACYDVTEGSGSGTVVVRHFDANGREFKLPQEQTQTSPDVKVR